MKYAFNSCRAMRLAVVITWREESLHSVLEFLKEKDLTVGTLVADRHHQITEWIEEEPRGPPPVWSTILMFGMSLKVSAGAHMHQLIISLLADDGLNNAMCTWFLLGFRKKVKALAKQKDYELVSKWEQHDQSHVLVRGVHPKRWWWCDDSKVVVTRKPHSQQTLWTWWTISKLRSWKAY